MTSISTSGWTSSRSTSIGSTVGRATVGRASRALVVSGFSRTFVIAPVVAAVVIVAVVVAFGFSTTSRTLGAEPSRATNTATTTTLAAAIGTITQGRNQGLR